uniref:RNase H type-1 domain-containing protein n=1 Tax=Aegilops tauschii subsp. strangulata TaxID=200361 RepID=A0A453SLV5_AEGTS
FMQSLAHDQFVLLAVTLWAIWTARRKAIHEGIFQSPQATNSFVRRFIDELNMITVRSPTRNSAAPAMGQRAVRPKAPHAGFAKIHVDAGVRARKGGSAAAVCRDGQGNYLGSSALVVAGLEDPAILEAVACREALALAADLNLHNFVIASDSKQTVADISCGGKGRNGSIIQEINVRATLFQCNFSFEGCAANVEAHKLVKYSLSLGPGRHLWLGQPHDPSCIPPIVVFHK